MMNQDPYSALLMAYEQRLRPGAEAFELPRTQELKLDNHIVSLEFAPHPDGAEEGMVICRTDVFRFQEQALDFVYRLLLQANNMCAGTRGSTLGLRGTDMVMASMGRRIGSLDADALDALLRALCADAEIWRRRLSAHGQQRSSPDTAQMSHMLEMRA